MNRFEGAEKAAAAKEAREAVGGSERHASGRTDDVKAALIHYLATEQYRESAESTKSSDVDEDQDSDESS